MLLSACIVDTPSETAASNMEFSGLELGMSILSSCLLVPRLLAQAPVDFIGLGSKFRMRCLAEDHGSSKFGLMAHSLSPPFFLKKMPTINRNYSPAVVFSIFNISLFSPEDLNIKLTIVLLSTLYCEVDWNGGLDPNNIREAMYLRLGWGRYKMNLNLRI